MDSKDGILVSPSCERGLDLYGDLARFNIWPKMPFPSLADKVVSKRLYTKPFRNRWYRGNYWSVGCPGGVGRTIRRIGDFSTAHIFDVAFLIFPCQSLTQKKGINPVTNDSNFWKIICNLNITR